MAIVPLPETLPLSDKKLKLAKLKRKVKYLPFQFLCLFLFFAFFLKVESQTLSIHGADQKASSQFLLPDSYSYLQARFQVPEDQKEGAFTFVLNTLFLGTKTLEEQKTLYARNRTELSWDFNLKNSGNYELLVKNAKGEQIAEESFRVMYSGIPAKPLFVPRFALDLNGKIPIEERSRFLYSAKDSLFGFFDLENETLTSKTLWIDTWQFLPDSSKKWVKTEQYQAKSYWDFVSFRISLPQPGAYEVCVYRADQSLIGCGELTLEKEENR